MGTKKHSAGSRLESADCMVWNDSLASLFAVAGRDEQAPASHMAARAIVATV